MRTRCSTTWRPPPPAGWGGGLGEKYQIGVQLLCLWHEKHRVGGDELITQGWALPDWAGERRSCLGAEAEGGTPAPPQLQRPRKRRLRISGAPPPFWLRDKGPPARPFVGRLACSQSQTGGPGAFGRRGGPGCASLAPHTSRAKGDLRHLLAAATCLRQPEPDRAALSGSEPRQQGLLGPRASRGPEGRQQPSRAEPSATLAGCQADSLPAPAPAPSGPRLLVRP